MRRLATVVAGLLLLATAAASPASGAEVVTSCDSQLTQLHGDVLAVPITGGKVDKERDGLVRLVAGATSLVEAGKPADAVVKLTNLQTKVDDLVAAGRVSPEAASTLTADIAAATECLTVG